MYNMAFRKPFWIGVDVVKVVSNLAILESEDGVGAGSIQFPSMKIRNESPVPDQTPERQ